MKYSLQNRIKSREKWDIVLCLIIFTPSWNSTIFVFFNEIFVESTGS